MEVLVFKKIEDLPIFVNLFIFIETLIILIPVFLNLNWGIFPYLFFMLSAVSMTKLSFLNGVLWIIGFSITSYIIYTLKVGFFLGAINSVLYGVGSFFFGGFGYALKFTVESKERVEKLLKELTIANEKLKEHNKRILELTILEERNRLSREMHDSIGHHLVTVSLELEILKKIIVENPNRAKELIENVKSEISKSLEELRDVVKTLRKPIETELPINESLENLALNFSSLKNIKLDIEIDKDIPDLSENYKITLLRVCQEALTNIEKHSKANKILVKLKKEGKDLKLIIEDDGVGFPDKIKENSFGLIGIKERANIFSGDFIFENRKEGGARIIFTLPIME